jgi:glycerophosphoryl diester phosphodiesterase
LAQKGERPEAGGDTNVKKGIARAAAALLGLALSSGEGADKERFATKDPLVIGHRGGGSGYLPDHTLEAYALGIELGVDYVELDVVATKDGHLVVRHEPNLIDTTNVGTLPQFAHRKRTLELDGVPVTGFFASDFTLAEIKQLRAVQPLPERGQAFDGQYEIPTLEEGIQFVKRKSAEKGRRIGIYVETKHPNYHQSIGLPLEDRLLEALRHAGWDRRGAPVFIQSFETANLRYLRTRTDLPLIQLIDGDDVKPDGDVALNKPYDKPYDWVVSGRSGLFSDLLTPAGLAEVRGYADGIGPWKPYIRSAKCIEIVGGACADANGDGKVDERDRVLLPPTDLVERAHALGLLVHPFTFRSEQRRLVSDYAGNPSNEYLMFYELGVDGVFTDFADDAVAARVQFLLKTDPNYGRCLVDNRCAERPDQRGLLP